MNMIEKILAKASGRKEVVPGDIVVANIDLMVMHDLSSNLVSRVFRDELKGGTIADPSRIVIVFDHNISPATQEAAESLVEVRRFASQHGIQNVFDCGSGSLHHVILEQGLWAPGQIIIGCDSHSTVYGALGLFSTGVGNNSMVGLGFGHSRAWFRAPQTIKVLLRGILQDGVSPRDVAQHLVGFMGEDGAVYKALEFAGPFVEALSIEDRMLFSLMSIDLGAKAGFINPDEKMAAYARVHSSFKKFDLLKNDPDVTYESEVDIDVSKIGPQVACPPTIGNVKPVEDVSGVAINIAEVGGSTGGRLEDMRVLGKWLTGKKVHPGIRMQVVPATRGIYLEALREGLIEVFMLAGANVFPPGAGSNQAVNMGAMAEGESMISTQARNFPGRNGHPKARLYLASTATVGASALTGRITDPRQAS
jgi:3-isopropylmalate/(R)-2-methylmalate dehydratase large subunit